MQSDRIEFLVAKAAREGNLDKLREAFASKAYQNRARANAVSKKNGNTALLLLLKYRHDFIVGPLLNNPHVDLNIRNNHQQDALTLCNDADLLEILLKDKRLIIPGNLHNRYHILMKWIRKNNPQAVTALLQYPTFIEAAHGIGDPETPLDCAINYGIDEKVEIVEILLTLPGITLEIADYHLTHAARVEHYNTALFLLTFPRTNVTFVAPDLNLDTLGILIFKFSQDKDAAKSPDNIYVQLIKETLCHPNMTENAMDATCGLEVSAMLRSTDRAIFCKMIRHHTTQITLNPNDKKSLSVNFNLAELVADTLRDMGANQTEVQSASKEDDERALKATYNATPVNQSVGHDLASAPPVTAFFKPAPKPPALAPKPSAPPVPVRPVPAPRKFAPPPASRGLSGVDDTPPNVGQNARMPK